MSKTLVDSLLEDDDTSGEENEVFELPEGCNPKDSDQHSECNSIHNSPHSSIDKGKASSPEQGCNLGLVITVNPIVEVGGETPEKASKGGVKSPKKRPISVPVDEGPHKKTKKPDLSQAASVAEALFPAGADPPKDPKDPKGPSEPKKDPPGSGDDPPGGGRDPPSDPPLPLIPPVAPKGKTKMSTRLSMKDVPLYKEGDDPIAFITSFTSYLNYYDIDLIIKIKAAGDVGFVSPEESAKDFKKHYTNPKTLLGRALQG